MSHKDLAARYAKQLMEANQRIFELESALADAQTREERLPNSNGPNSSPDAKDQVIMAQDAQIAALKAGFNKVNAKMKEVLGDQQQMEQSPQQLPKQIEQAREDGDERRRKEVEARSHPGGDEMVKKEMAGAGVAGQPVQPTTASAGNPFAGMQNKPLSLAASAQNTGRSNGGKRAADQAERGETDESTSKKPRLFQFPDVTRENKENTFKSIDDSAFASVNPTGFAAWKEASTHEVTPALSNEGANVKCGQFAKPFMGFGIHPAQSNR